MMGLFKIVEQEGNGRVDPTIVFHALIADTLPTNDPNEIEDLAVEAVLNESSDEFSFCESEWVDDRTVEVIAFKS